MSWELFRHYKDEESTVATVTVKGSDYYQFSSFIREE